MSERARASTPFTLPVSVGCLHCGASLGGSTLDGECSSCSRPVGDSLKLSAIDAQSGLVADATCACGYELRHQPLAGRCPECDSPVVQALRPGGLTSATQRWLRAQRRGVVQLFFMLIGVGVMIVINTILANPISNLVRYDRSGWSLMVALAGFLFWLYLYLAGLWRVSSADAPGRGPQISAVLRFTTRGLAIAVLFTPVAGALLRPIPQEVILMAGGFVAAIDVICVNLCLQHLARQVGERRLLWLGRCQIAAAAFAACVFSTVAVLHVLASPAVGLSAVTGILRTLTGVPPALPFVYGVVLLIISLLLLSNLWMALAAAERRLTPRGPEEVSPDQLAAGQAAPSADSSTTPAGR